MASTDERAEQDAGANITERGAPDGALGSVAAHRAEERAEVRGEETGFFKGEEVAAAGRACLLADVGIAAFGVLAGIVAVF